MKDITFYDLNFNRLYILPQVGTNKGYISVYVQKDFNGMGSLEIDFVDDDLKKIVKDYRDNLMIEWNGFWGLLSAYQDKENKIKLTGESLNALLKRAVVRLAGEQNDNIEVIALSALFQERNWLVFKQTGEFTNLVTYKLDTYRSADEYICELVSLDGAGYEIKPDFGTRTFVFELLKSKDNPLILSTNNLNAYEFSETYINREIATGGYYQEETDGVKEWKYLSLDESAVGVFKKDVVLNSTTRAEALQELKAKIADTETELKTKGITYGTDYNLGDVVRVQNNDTAVKKRIASVIMSQENGYIENPIFSEVE